MKKIFFSLLLIFISVLSVVIADELSVSSYVDKTQLTIDENLSLTIEINSDKNITSEPTFPQLTGFQLIGQSSSSSTSIEFINGKMSKRLSKKFIYTLEPLKVGEFIIPPVLVRYHKKEYHTNSIKVKVLPPESNITPKIPSTRKPYSPRVGGRDIFLEAAANKQSVFVGEPVVVSYKLYSKENLIGLNAEKFPEFSGFIKEETYQAKSIAPQIEVKDGIRYYCYKISKFTIFPTSAGKFTTEPMKLIGQYEVPPRNFFDFGTTREKRVSSNTITINVKELPIADQPADFSGAVGQFYMGTNLSSKQVKAGESMTLTITISGTGNIKMFQPPKLPQIPNIDTFAPETTDMLTNPDKTEGKKVIKYILIPEEPGKYEIPPISFSFYDTQQNRYRQISTSPIKFNVLKGEKQIAEHYYPTQKEINIQGSDICFIKTDSAIENFSLVFYQIWYWLIVMISSITILIAYLYRREKDKLLKDNAYYRAKIADKVLDRDMRKVKEALSTRQPDNFSIFVDNALKNYIANKLNISVSGTKIKDITDALKKNGVEEKLIQKVRDILILTDQARFGKMEIKKEEMDRKFTELKSIINKLGKVKMRR
jgi:hypothetical protein